MPQIYTPPSNNDSAGIYEFFRYVGNTATDGLFFPVIMSVIWIIVFVGTKQFSTSRAFTMASFVCMISSITLSVIDLIAPKFMYLFIVLTAMGALWIKLDTGPGF